MEKSARVYMAWCKGLEFERAGNFTHIQAAGEGLHKYNTSNGGRRYPRFPTRAIVIWPWNDYVHTECKKQTNE